MPRKKAVQDWAGALKGPAPAAGQVERSMLALEIPTTLHSEMRELAAQLGKKAGKRVLLTDLVIEALGDLLAKHKRH